MWAGTSWRGQEERVEMRQGACWHAATELVPGCDGRQRGSGSRQTSADAGLRVPGIGFDRVPWFDRVQGVRGSGAAPRIDYRQAKADVAKKAIVGKKVGMTQIWDAAGRVVPVTVLSVEPMRVVRLKTRETEGYSALQVTFGYRAARQDGKRQSGAKSAYARGRVNKPEAGHFAKAGVDPGERLVELRLDDVAGYEVGQELTASVLQAGERVDVTAVAKGKGFAGGVKRHNFSGQGAAHGNHKKHRAPGSVGACATPARVFKGTRMAGRMGGGQVTTLNLEVVQADPERRLVLVKGAVPGPRGGMVVIRNTNRAVSSSGNGSGAGGAA